MAQQVSGVMCFSADIPVTGSTLTLAIPEGWVVLEVIMNIQTSLGGTDTVLVGVDNDTDAFLADADVGTGAAGYYRASEGTAANANGLKIASGRTVVIVRNTYTSGGGEVYVYAASVVA